MRRCPLHRLLTLLLCLVAATPVGAADLSALEAAARAEGRVVSLGMPDEWANWGELWRAMGARTGVVHTDTDMSSGEALARLEVERDRPSVDVTEVGLEFAPLAVRRGLADPYKPADWDAIPAWARDPEGRWALAYTGTIAFLVARTVKNPPRRFADLLGGDYKVSVGEVGRASQSNVAVLAAAFALGGSEKDLRPAMALFGALAASRRLVPLNVFPATMRRGEVEVALVWDFNALAYRDIVGREGWDVLIPEDGSATGGYTTILNPRAPHPAAARLLREYAFSDAGQVAFARGYARPIRVGALALPPDAADRILPAAQYARARLIDGAAWAEAARPLVRQWRELVLSRM